MISLNTLSQENIRSWNLFHAVFMLIGCILYLLTHWINFVSIPGLLSFSYFVFLRIQLKEQKTLFGYANSVTTLRILIIASIGIFYSQLSLGVLFSALMLTVVLDWVDGKIAKIKGEVSEFGSYLDMEADAFYVLTTTVLLYHLDLFSGWIVLIGLLRYIHVILTHVILPQKKTEPRLQINAIAAGILFIALPLPLISDYTYISVGVTLSSLLVVSTFCVSFGLMKFKLSE